MLDVLQIIYSNILLFPHWLLAIIVALIFCWLTTKPAKHAWRICQADKVISNLKKIGLESGPGYQFGYLRSKSVSPYTYEEAILTSLKHRKLKIRRSPSYSGDGGIDGTAWWQGKLILIQAKLYSGYINPQHVRNFQAICQQRNALAIFCHSGKSGPKSKEISSSNFDIVSGERMLKLLCGEEIVLFPQGLKISLKVN